MTYTENVYTCLSCLRSHANRYSALVCHKRGFIRKPQEMQALDLGYAALLVLANTIVAGLHNN